MELSLINMWVAHIKEAKQELRITINKKIQAATPDVVSAIIKQDPLYTITQSNGNRYLIASKDIKAGQLVLTQPSLAYTINEKYHSKICHNCFQCAKLKICSACNVS